MKKNWVIILVSFLLIENANGQNHPFIIVRESEYDSLQNRSTEWPWSKMKTLAMETAQNAGYNSGLSYGNKCDAAFDLAGAAALAYLLDTSNRKIYLGTAENVVSKLINDVRTGKENSTSPTAHEFSVPPAHATLMVYIMLDIMYEELDPVTRKNMEQDCDYIASNHNTAWWASKYSLEATMELYHNGLSVDFIEKKNQYRDYILSNISEDGVYTTGPGYTSSRLYKDERSQKKLFMDIAEYQGFGEFYSNQKFRDLHEWIFGFAFTPFNRSYTFGDSPPTKSLNEWTAPALRLSRFSPKAQQFAAWHIGSFKDSDIVGNILHYILCDHVPLSPMKPRSRIFQNGGAWLLDTNYHQESLSGVLWNINTSNESHSHRDANSINIIGFGDHILRNSGYDGWGLPDASTWEWIHSTAASSNTITIGRFGHSNFRGGGITEGITGYGIEYASGNSGPSIIIGNHDRNLLFIKPEEGVPGYFVLFDEVEVWNPLYPILMHLHPNSDVPPLIDEDEKVYDWTIKKCYTNHDVRVKICLANNPILSEIKDGYLASYNSCSRFTGKYMEHTYEPESSGNLGITTLIYPFLSGQNTPSFNRIQGMNCTGTEFRFNAELSDYTFKSDTSNEGIYNGIRFKAKAVYLRAVEDDVLNYFARKGTMMDYQGDQRYGYESEKPISIICTGKTGNIISDSTLVTLFYPEIDNILLDSSKAVVLEQGNGWIKIYVPEGNHHFQIESPFTVSIKTSEITTGGEFHLNIPPEKLSLQIYPNPFSVSTTIRSPNPTGKAYRMHLYDISGKLVRTVEDISTEEFLFKRNGLGKGMYIIEMKGDKTYQGKLLVE